MKSDKVGGGNGAVSVGHDEVHPGDGIRVESSRGISGVGAWITPAEARALAALLLKHADRAEGRGT